MSTNEIKLEIERVLSPLVNEEFRYIFRAGNMLTLGFGEDVEYLKYNGQKMISAKYAIHVQTSWRISINDVISVGSLDFNIPNKETSYDEFYKDINGGFGKSLFDTKSHEINEYLIMTPTKVVGVCANDFGDLHVHMEHNISLDVFVDSAKQDEHWRFFIQNDGSKHFIVFDV